MPVVAVYFLALSLYVVNDSIRSLIAQEPPDESVQGFILAAASLVTMPFWPRQKEDRSSDHHLCITFPELHSRQYLADWVKDH